MKDALGGITIYGYDANDNLTTVTDSLNRTTEYGYDELNRRTRATLPSGRTTSYTYDVNGNLIEDSDGTNVTRYSYNVEGKLIEVEKPDSSLIEYGYDGDGRRIIQTINGMTTRFYYDRNQKRNGHQRCH